LVKDGCKLFFEQVGPSNSDTQPRFRDPSVHEEVRKKILKVVNRRYVVRSSLDIKALIKYFAVPKGLDDIRIVYDATASGLNACVWAPSFWLPTVDTLLRALDSNSWMADRDIGDMFLNFELHQSASWPYAGVDLTPILTEADDPKLRDPHHWV
jgi:hypothetical protein